MTSFTSPALLRLRRRRHGRGAAFVESLIVIAMILFFLFCVLWFQALYAAKLGTMQAARANAWASALAGCPGLENSQSMLSDAVKQSDSAGPQGGGDSTEGQVGGLTADGDGEDSPDWFSLREGGEASESVDFTAIMSGAKMNISTTRKFQCNERSNPNELKLSAGDLLSNLASVIRDLFN
jgi:hypothetical protein